MKETCEPFISINPSEQSVQENYRTLVAGVSPRPIALVSTQSLEGTPNLAPFSFFNVFGANPPMVAFSPTLKGRDGTTKDTLRNVREVPECVIHCVPYSLVQQTNLASTEYAGEVDEFIKTGLTPISSLKVKPPRVLESPFQMECKVTQVIELGGKPASGNLILCEVIQFHISPKVIRDGAMDLNLLDLVGRDSGNFYTHSSGNALFEVEKPIGKLGIGVDHLPDFIRSSTFLQPNHLGMLGGLEHLPSNKEVTEFLGYFLAAKVDEKDTLKYLDMKSPESLMICAISQMEANLEKALELTAVAARTALDQGNIPWAIKTLLCIPLITEAHKHDG